MNMMELKSIARNQGINPGKLGKVPLIRSIQREEGNFDCFATATLGFCDQTLCKWRSDCFEISTKPNGKIEDQEDLSVKMHGKSHGKSNGARPALR